MKRFWTLGLLLFISEIVPCLGAAEFPTYFFSIGKIFVKNRPSRSDNVEFQIQDGLAKTSQRTFLPHIKVAVQTQEQIYSMHIFAKAYFYDKDKKLIVSMEQPSLVDRNDGTGLSAMPVFFRKNRKEDVYFILPRKIANSFRWSVVVVFGDQHGAVASLYSRQNVYIEDFDFPEKSLVEKPQVIERPPAVNPLIEHTIKTGLPNYPQITLFLRKPIGTDDFSEAKGVLAICVLAHTIADVKRKLQEADEKNELSVVFDFAEKHKLAIICWGSRSLWNPRANWDELSRDDYRRMNAIFNDVARAWGRGVLSLARKYGLPTKNYLLLGNSASAQYAARLAMRQPQYFLAVHVHIPSSFDKPTVRAKNILWCLTTGEEEAGYDRSLEFLEECQKLGYPIIYKAIPKLGHASHPAATRLGLVFFEYALALNEQRGAQKDVRNIGVDDFACDFQATFQAPQYWGDIFRQQVYSATIPAEERPPAILVPLPTEAIAKAWNNK